MVIVALAGKRHRQHQQLSLGGTTSPQYSVKVIAVGDSVEFCARCGSSRAGNLLVGASSGNSPLDEAARHSEIDQISKASHCSDSSFPGFHSFATVLEVPVISAPLYRPPSSSTVISASCATPCREIPTTLLSSFARGGASSGRALNNAHERHDLLQWFVPLRTE